MPAIATPVDTITMAPAGPVQAPSRPRRLRLRHGLSATISLLFLVLPLVSGCVWNRGTVGDRFTDEAIAAIKKGVTTRTEVVAALGAPARIMEANGREIFQYYRYDAKHKGLFLLIVNFSRINLASDDLYVRFNKDGVVEDVAFSKRTDRLPFQFWPFDE